MSLGRLRGIHWALRISVVQFEPEDAHSWCLVNVSGMFSEAPTMLAKNALCVRASPVFDIVVVVGREVRAGSVRTFRCLDDLHVSITPSSNTHAALDHLPFKIRGSNRPLPSLCSHWRVFTWCLLTSPRRLPASYCRSQLGHSRPCFRCRRDTPLASLSWCPTPTLHT